jgi:hypothetical protein
MAVVFLVPFPGLVAVGFRQLREDLLRLNPEAGKRPFLPVSAESTHPIDGDLPQPRPKRTIATPLESRQLADHDKEHFLTQVVDLAAQTGHLRQPEANEGQVKILQALPLRSIWRCLLEPFEQAERSRIH